MSSFTKRTCDWCLQEIPSGIEARGEGRAVKLSTDTGVFVGDYHPDCWAELLDVIVLATEHQMVMRFLPVAER